MDGIDRYRPNSKDRPKTTNQEPQPNERPKMKRVEGANVTVKKQGVWTRVRTTLMAEDARTVGSFVFVDVVIPKLKDLLYEIVTQGTHRALHGRSDPRGTVSLVRNGGFTNYNRPGSQRSDQGKQPEPEDRSRPVHDFTRFTFGTAAHAQQVADSLLQHVQEYGLATVADFYEGIGLSADFTDYNYGWSDISGVRVRGVHDGFILELPRPQQIDK